MIHNLKCHPDPYRAILRGLKTCEFRLNDRNFRVGDLVDLFEYWPESDCYTGANQAWVISHIQTGFGIPDGYVMLSLRVI